MASTSMEGAMASPITVELNLQNDVFDQAVRLAREAATSVIHGGPAATVALEFVLTASANDRVLGATVLLLLASVSGHLALDVIDLQADDGDDSSRVARATQVVNDYLYELGHAGRPDVT